MPDSTQQQRPGCPGALRRWPENPMNHTSKLEPETPVIAPLFVRVEDAARALAIGRTNLYRLLGEGKLRATKLGGRTLIAVAEIEAFASRLQQGA